MVFPAEIQALRTGVSNINQGVVANDLEAIKRGVSQIEEGFTLADRVIQSGGPRSDDLREKISVLAWEVLRFLIQRNLNAQALRIVKLVEDRAGKLVFQGPKPERLHDFFDMDTSSVTGNNASLNVPFRFSMDESDIKSKDFLADLEESSKSIRST